MIKLKTKVMESGDLNIDYKIKHTNSLEHIMLIDFLLNKIEENGTTRKEVFKMLKESRLEEK